MGSGETGVEVPHRSRACPPTARAGWGGGRGRATGQVRGTGWGGMGWGGLSLERAKEEASKAAGAGGWGRVWLAARRQKQPLRTVSFGFQDDCRGV